MKINKKFRNLMEHAVVRIKIESIDINWKLPYQVSEIGAGLGSGFFISPEYIMTCSHVVDGAKNAYIEIPVLGTRIIPIEVVGICPSFDLALCKTIGYKSKYYLKMGDSNKCDIGEEVYVVGYPKNYSQSKDDINNLKFTNGIISGVQYGLIQTDSAINSGNSGGPLVLGNKVIGVNSRKAIGDDTDLIGYAIPINQYKTISSDFLKLKPESRIVYRPSFAFEFSNTNDTLLNVVTNDHAKNGVYVSHIYPHSPLSEIDIKIGDVITKIDNYKVDSYGMVDKRWLNVPLDIYSFLNDYKLNQKISIEFYRNNKKYKKKIQLKPYKAEIRICYPLYEPVEYVIFGGMVFMNLTMNHMKENIPMIMKYLDPVKQEESKVIVSFIFPNSPTFILNNFSISDICIKCNHIKIKNIDDIIKAMNKPIEYKKKKYIVFENELGKILMFPLDKLILHDMMLSQIYKYPLTPFHMKHMKEMKMGNIKKILKNKKK